MEKSEKVRGLSHYHPQMRLNSGFEVLRNPALNVHKQYRHMIVGTVVLLGNVTIDRNVFDSVASEFELAVAPAPTLAALRKMCVAGDAVAVLFDAHVLGLSWNDALETVLLTAPGVLPVVYAGFSETVPWPELSDAGAFHVLRRPINESEARHTLGFIWAAKRGDRPRRKLAAGETSRADSRQPSVAARG